MTQNLFVYSLGVKVPKEVEDAEEPGKWDTDFWTMEAIHNGKVRGQSCTLSVNINIDKEGLITPLATEIFIEKLIFPQQSLRNM